jgi:hypothetical protein
MLVQLARREVNANSTWRRTADHVPAIPEFAHSDDLGAEFAPLDVRLLQDLGFRAYFDASARESTWPIPFGMTPHELALFGEREGVSYTEPQSGDIFLQRSFYANEYIHAGLVMTVDGRVPAADHMVCFLASTVEGDTDHRGLLGRGYTCKLRRRFNPAKGDRFLRWCELDTDRFNWRAA